jgi:hypothetical protein
MSPRAAQSASNVRVAALRRSALILANAISIGFRSGEYCGRNRSHAPRALSALAARALLWTESSCGPRALVDREIVRDHDIAAPKGRGKLGLDIGVERGPIHGAVHHPGRAEPVTPERGDEGLGAPAAERRRGAQALSATAAPAQPRHLRVDRRLVDEHQARRLKPHPGLTLVDPLPSSLTHVGAFALRGHQLFFYM